MMRDNLVVIVPDTMRRPETLPGTDWRSAAPFFHAFSERATLLSGSVASAPWTIPSHLALLRGADPWARIGTDAGAPGRLSYATSLAQLWGELGGESIACSVNPTVNERQGVLDGFDEVRPHFANRAAEVSWMASNALDIGCGLLGRLDGSGESPDLRGPLPRNGRGWSSVPRALPLAGRALSLPFDSTHVLRSLAGFLRERRSSRRLLVFVNLMDMHEPYLPAARTARGLPTATLAGLSSSNLSLYAGCLAQEPEAAEAVRAAYSASLRRLDRTLGELFGLLERHEVLTRSRVVCVSDHGQSLGEHDFFGHGWNLHDEIVRVPAYAWSRGYRSEVGAEPIATMIDHRHLHHVLCGLARDPDLSLARAVADAAIARGPAASFVRARRLERFNPFRRSAEYQSVRLWDEAGEVAMGRTGESDAARVDRAVGPSSEVLMEQGAAILSGRESGDPPRRMYDESDVAARLSLWGYE